MERTIGMKTLITACILSIEFNDTITMWGDYTTYGRTAMVPKLVLNTDTAPIGML